MDWRRVKADYIAGGTSYRKLADKYGVSFNTLKKRATEEQWYELRQQKDHNVTTRIVNVVSEKEIQKAVDIIDVADKLLEKAAELMEMPLTTQSFKQLTSALKDLKEIKGYKTDADIREQEARIKKLEAEINGENRDATIVVHIDDGAGDWSK